MQIIITSVLMITLWLSTFQLIPNERKEFKPTIAPRRLPCDDDDKVCCLLKLSWTVLGGEKLGRQSAESESDLPVKSGERPFWLSLFHVYCI